MIPKSLLVANRGEIAIRIIRAAAEMDIRTVTVYSEDDTNSLHTRKADAARALRGTGAAAYLDIEQMVAVAKAAECDAIHPGYGFLSENAAFARRCAEERIIFTGPRAEVLELFGDKVRARALAERLAVPVLRGTASATSLDEAREFLASLGGGAMMIKAIAGGGGRGMRAVYRAVEIEEAYTRCQSEARAAFGNGEVYVEELMPRARHIEVQIIGDGSGAVSHLWERECSIQRRNQKVIEIAPSPGLAPHLRDRLLAAAVRMAKEVRYDSLGTFEFLVDAAAKGDETAYAFIETNPRLQVEHTVTEAVTGIDLVKTQLQLAAGRSLAQLGLRQADIPAPRGFAIQTRINMESMGADGSAKPSGGILTAFEPPSGPGLRVDTFAYAGYATNPRFDSLLAKLVVHSPSADYTDAVARAYRALCEFKIVGVSTNIGFLQSLLRHPAFAANDIYTRFVEDHIAELAAATNSNHRRLFFDQPAPTEAAPLQSAGAPRPAGGRLAGARIDGRDPLAILVHGKSNGGVPEVAEALGATALIAPHEISGPDGTVAVAAPMQGTIVSIDVREGDVVRAGEQLLIMEAMKMEHVIHAHVSGVVRRIAVVAGNAVFDGYPLLFIEESEVELVESADAHEVDLDRIRPDLAEVHARHAIGLD
ncbi:MAG: biotin carboxylase N-terminal domain-containing protein, partial [Candidatus Binataceae bacterium]